jgi:hypothetical protein
MNKRWPEVGDLLFQKSNDETHTGLIYKIEGGSSPMGTGRVHVEWTTDAPNDYNWEYGYSPVNIHNQFHVFEIKKP